MKTLAMPTDASARQTVTKFTKLQTLEATVPLGCTDQKISDRASLRRGNRFDLVLAGAQKVTQVAHRLGWRRC